MSILKFIASLVLAAGTALAVGLYLGNNAFSLSAIVTPTDAQPCPPAVPLGLTDFVKDGEIQIHVSYNSLTKGHSKSTYRKGAEVRYVLMGEKDGHHFRCSVSEEFYNATGENTHVRIPAHRCREILP